MTKKIALLLTLALVVGLFAGCAGTPVVYYSDCTCPEGSHAIVPSEPAITEGTVSDEPIAEGAVKTGLAVIANQGGSASAEGENNVEVAYDVTIVAVTVTDDGVIDSCVIDSLGADVAFEKSGAPIDFDPDAEILTKNELGENYGMKAYAGSKYEWNEQAAALAAYAKGKTVEELKSGAVNESGYAADADLATTATIYIGGYVSAIEAAVANAQHLGAQAGDELKLASINSLNAGPAETEGGAAELTCDVTALTMNGDTITSCVIDALQAQVAFDGTGTITTDLTAVPQTKNQLGEAYGMKAYAGATYEWNEQAAFFAEYVTGKTANEIANMSINESGKTEEADLATTVTIAVGGFQALVLKAAQ